MTKAQYLKWINEDPRVIKDNSDGSKYVPISCVQEDFMTGYGGNTKMELLRESYHSQGLSGIGRLHYLPPGSKEWLFQDGSASIPFDKGMRLDFPKLSSMIMLSCAKKIGKRFGQHLNRDIEDQPMDASDTFIDKRQPIDAIMQKKLELAISKGDTKTVDEIKENYVI